jgi:hypothetical protein
MKTCQQCGGTGRSRTRTDTAGLGTYCTACNGRGEIGGDEPWIKTSGLFGGTTIYDTAPVWRSGPLSIQALIQELEDLRRRVARLETMQRRKPKRKAGRR